MEIDLKKFILLSKYIISKYYFILLRRFILDLVILHTEIFFHTERFDGFFRVSENLYFRKESVIPGKKPKTNETSKKFFRNILSFWQNLFSCFLYLQDKVEMLDSFRIFSKTICVVCNFTIPFPHYNFCSFENLDKWDI